ncbi:MAG: DUF302 domain-containing protein [Actinomycetota bacterium]|jgi:uncharacterized protein (DUF302 family)|nr:DUF302 domain-containing protein [Actinomycetota bacterium]
MKALEKVVSGARGEVEPAVRRALADQGFGVLTEIDVEATLEAKLGEAGPPVTILGACNPGFAKQALERDPSVALLLPCNVVLRDVDGGTLVSIVDPRELMDAPGFEALADEAAGRLQLALDAL